jgi:hypothetical protein
MPITLEDLIKTLRHPIEEWVLNKATSMMLFTRSGSVGGRLHSYGLAGWSRAKATQTRKTFHHCKFVVKEKRHLLSIKGSSYFSPTEDHSTGSTGQN